MTVRQMTVHLLANLPRDSVPNDIPPNDSLPNAVPTPRIRCGEFFKMLLPGLKVEYSLTVSTIDILLKKDSLMVHTACLVVNVSSVIGHYKLLAVKTGKSIGHVRLPCWSPSLSACLHSKPLPCLPSCLVRLPA